MKKIITLLLIGAIIVGDLSLFSCGEDTYNSEIKSVDLANALCEAIGEEDTAFYGEIQYELIFGSDIPECDKCIVYSTETNNIDEIGIFSARDNDEAERIEEILGSYIEEMSSSSRAFVASYAPDELRKLDAAEVFRIGNRVFYTVLSTSDRETVKEKARSMLKE